MGDLKLNGATSGTITVTPTAVAGTNTITLPASTGTVALTASPTFSGTLTATTITSPASTALTVQSAGTTAMTVDTSQNVGIGTSSPSSKLSVGGNPPSSGAIAGVASSGGTSLALSDNANNSLYVRHPSGAATLCTDSGGALAFATNGNTERMRIDSSGNLLVGTTNVDPIAARANGYSFVPGTCFRIRNPSGAFAVGLSSTSGNIAVFFTDNGSAAVACGSIAGTGSTTSYNTSSDYRLKENVVSMTTGLATVKALKPVTYDWISDQSAGEGFIAHELQAVIPLAVTGEKDAVNDDGSIKPQGVDYSKVVVHLVAAIQELSAKNDALEARLAALEAK